MAADESDNDAEENEEQVQLFYHFSTNMLTYHGHVEVIDDYISVAVHEQKCSHLQVE